MIEQDTKDLIDRLLRDVLPLAGIARVTGVSERWLQTYVNAKFNAISKQVEVCPKKKGDWLSNVMKCGRL